MTALQRISASIKRRRDSLFERPNPPAEFEEFEDEQKILQEAKSFICEQQNEGNCGFSAEELKTLRFLCDMLESSLNLTRSEKEIQQQGQSSIGKRDRSGSTIEGGLEKDAQEAAGGYTTWAAGAARGQRHLLNKLMMANNSQQQRKISTGANVTGGIIPEMDTIHEEEHEQPASTLMSATTTAEGGMSTLMGGLGEIKEAMKIDPEMDDGENLIIYEEPEPLFVVILPHLAMLICVIFYLFLGSLFYRWIDPEIGGKSSARAFIWAFQLLATIGWGDSHASTTFSQAFTVLYILAGIPMLFSAYANFGRLLTEFCCRQGPQLWHKLIGMGGKKEETESDELQRLPLMAITNLLAFHQCIGLLIYSVWLKNWPVISTIYFSITTMATSGFGDFHPDTDSWMETIVAIVYISAGIVLLSALFLTIALYYQTLHYVQFKEAVAKFYGHFLEWKKGNLNKKNDLEKHTSGK